MSLFPMLGDNLVQEAAELPLCREVMADPKTGLPVWRNGSPVIVEGLEAVRLWCVTALRTWRCHFDIYTQNFGSEIPDLIGHSYSEAVKQAEAPRMVREALLVNPYIQAVDHVAVSFEGTTLTIGVAIQTIYGATEVKI